MKALTVYAKFSEDLSVIRTDSLIGFVGPKYFLSGQKFSTTDRAVIKKINYGTRHGTHQTFAPEKDHSLSV